MILGSNGKALAPVLSLMSLQASADTSTSLQLTCVLDTGKEHYSCSQETASLY